jgi:choline dehydrogenase-like flavoprotein
MSYGENEVAMVKDMAASAAEMLEAAGAKNIRMNETPNIPGSAIHEVGVARMGNSPKASVLNSYLQSHDIQNLFVMDAAGFSTGPCQNPTLTIMALCVRSCEYIMDEMKKGAI